MDSSAPKTIVITGASDGIGAAASRLLTAKLLMATPEKGAAQLVRFAQTEPGVDWQSGAYYESGHVARRTNPQARDADLARRLWERSEQLVGVAAA
ncbi:hypothetical protein AB1046_05005 [Promicromonospora sp. Populi]|uniref:hypothetical protein n=1 Tax=Promicromonospora sp. Populi TaxID=3239420 RepID=UPI0034E26BF9